MLATTANKLLSPVSGANLKRSKETVSRTCPDARSTTSLKCLKQSAPKLGKSTAAKRNVQVKDLPEKDSVRVLSPQQGIT